MTLLLKGINQSINTLVNSGLLSRVNSNWHSMGAVMRWLRLLERRHEEDIKRCYQAPVLLSRVYCHTPIELRSLMKRSIDRWIRQTSTHSGEGNELVRSSWKNGTIDRSSATAYSTTTICGSTYPIQAINKKKNTVIQSKTKTKKQLKQWYKVEEEDVERRSR